jgi:hypothetical protein
MESYLSGLVVAHGMHKIVVSFAPNKDHGSVDFLAIF